MSESIALSEVAQAREARLRVDDLAVTFKGAKRLGAKAVPLRAVQDVSLRIGPGETLGLVGESGSGKSTTARAIMRLVEPSSGGVWVGGREVTGLAGGKLRSLRRDIQMVFQDPYSSLNPSRTVGASISEPLEIHQPELGRAARAEEVARLLDMVGLPSAVASRYPHEFSGGQRQRIAIARALALRPSVLVCDEAVSALDVSTQNQIIDLLKQLQTQLGISMLFISHDLSVVRHIAHRVAVMYFGRIVEMGTVDEVFDAPVHPYTRALLGSVPVPHPAVQRSRGRQILAGEVPDLAKPPPGCAFASRCPWATDHCRQAVPMLIDHLGGRLAACHHPLVAS